MIVMKQRRQHPKYKVEKKGKVEKLQFFLLKSLSILSIKFYYSYYNSLFILILLLLSSSITLSIIKSSSSSMKFVSSLSLFPTCRKTTTRMSNKRRIRRYTWNGRCQPYPLITTDSTCTTILQQQRQRQQWLSSTTSTELSSTNDNCNTDTSNTSNKSKKSIEYQYKNKILQDSSILSSAPMMDYTDYHFRHLLRCGISNNILLYSEMVAANAICHEYDRIVSSTGSDITNNNNNNNNNNNALMNGYEHSYLQRNLGQGRVHPLEGASVLQLGGSDPQQLYDAAKIVLSLQEMGYYCNYTAINLNCGCPSSKVAGSGCFGAALMNEPQLVNELTQAIYEGSNGMIPVTVKCRIGTDINQPFHRLTYDTDVSIQQREYDTLCQFIETVSSNNIVTDYIVHARIAVLSKSFSPADNRKIPPLKYHVVHNLVKDYPQYHFTLNGGLNTIQDVQLELQKSKALSSTSTLQGIMIGRALAADPWSFALTDQLLYNNNNSNNNNIVDYKKPKNRLEVLQQYGIHADYEEAHAYNGDVQNVRRGIIKAISSLFTGEMNAKKYRIALDDIARLPKQLKLQGMSTTYGQPPISELILNAATQHLSEETLLRTPEESYDRILHSGRIATSTGRSASIDEWQEIRKDQEASNPSSYNEMLTNGIG